MRQHGISHSKFCMIELDNDHAPSLVENFCGTNADKMFVVANLTHLLLRS